MNWQLALMAWAVAAVLWYHAGLRAVDRVKAKCPDVSPVILDALHIGTSLLWPIHMPRVMAKIIRMRRRGR